ncbi:MAG: hypothetical protein HYY16_11245 [Planctomycetes bacterium]|nr:hypothetical protein [Planctomycetota bacterium]
MKSLCASFAVLLGGCIGARDAGPSMGMAAARDAVRVAVSVKEGKIRVDAEGGAAVVEFAGVSAHVQLVGGQRFDVGFDARSREFHVEILEDADGAIDVGIGETLVHSTRGDIFDARVLGEHLDVMVRRGLVHVMGPDRRSQEVSQGGQILVGGGARGAIHGTTPPAPVQPLAPARIPREPRRPPILDRSDIAPAP